MDCTVIQIRNHIVMGSGGKGTVSSCEINKTVRWYFNRHSLVIQHRTLALILPLPCHAGNLKKCRKYSVSRNALLCLNDLLACSYRACKFLCIKY
jgi:hypothetical protein